MTDKLGPEYCTHCGTLMEKKFVFSHYSAKNGYRLYKLKYFCPHRKWLFSLHDYFWVMKGSASDPEFVYYYNDGDVA